MAVCFLARWTRLFRKESLWHCAVCGIRTVLSGGERRPLGYAFNKEVTTSIGSTCWGGSSINIAEPPACSLFRILPLLLPLLVAEPPKCLGPPTPVIVPRTSDGDAGDPPTLEVR